ncbi:MAG: esterase family protein [Bacteroidales bacterium]|nr:esterase family protein [Bacteroidales bacterium]
MMRHRSFFFFVCLALGAVLALGACSKLPAESPADGQQNLLDLLNAEDKVYRDQQLTSAAMGRTMKYTVWLPGGYDASRKYPFLYLLHGYGDDNNSWLDKGGAQRIAKDYVAKGGTPMVIVMPDGLVNFYSGAWETYFHEELIPAVEKDFKSNGRRAVAGLSMGGYGTLYNVLNHPDKFLYGYAMSPATDLVGFEQLVRAQADPAVFPPIVLESGKQDFTVTIESVREFSEMLTGHKVRHDFIERDGGHDWNFWPVCLEKALVKIGEALEVSEN